MSDEQVFRVLPKQAQGTLAAALREWLPNQSWSQIRRLVTRRHVMVSGNVCVDAGRRLKLQDVIKILPHPAAAPPKEHDIRIHYADADVVVVEKPAGMTSIRHVEERSWPARRKQIQPTLDELLPRVLERQGRSRRSRRGRPSPVRAVHRLDRETSGLMVFARNVKAERHLGLQFRGHLTHRRYLAVVHGRVEAQTFNSRLIRDRGDGRRGSTDKPDVGKHAVTHVRPLEYLGDYTLLECRLETGRTHQIRIHLAEAGHPLCGEKVYNQPYKARPRPDHSGAPRLALHAAELGFEHPASGEQKQFDMPLPPDLEEFIKRLRI